MHFLLHHFPLHSSLCLVVLGGEEENIIVIQSENAAIDSEMFEGETCCYSCYLQCLAPELLLFTHLCIHLVNQHTHVNSITKEYEIQWVKFSHKGEQLNSL